eukprot:CAMPEP_0185251566 /NCGR_PEP_ID=MMETSP1359-20130426/942_1 /TAXON_ID=552665 /ORGANISM="Bigelowiella longifila, Strain CCMP242" /LENGTH=259 /DNA_ID=CAMNT_0027833513 /DNA_START=41 /DNA_END=821 /DNA_ORIENTATION=-
MTEISVKGRGGEELLLKRVFCVIDDLFTPKIYTGKKALNIHRICRLVNIANAVLLVFTGIWSILTSAFRPIVFIFGLYVIIFSCCLGCFEFRCPWDYCQQFFLKNLGFLFTWKGRLLFYFFIASLIIGQGLVGMIIGIATLVNCAFNVFVICKYPDYYELLKKEAEEMRQGALEDEIKKQVATAATGYAMKEVRSSVHKMMGMDEVEEMVGDNSNDFMDENDLEDTPMMEPDSSDLTGRVVTSLPRIDASCRLPEASTV